MGISRYQQRCCLGEDSAGKLCSRVDVWEALGERKEPRELVRDGERDRGRRVEEVVVPCIRRVCHVYPGEYQHVELHESAVKQEA